MHEIHLIFIEKEDANKANDLLYSFFKGSELYIHNNIVITPIKKEIQVVNSSEVERWAFNVCFYDDISNINEEDAERIVISAGELNVMNRKTLWAFDILDPSTYITKHYMEYNASIGKCEEVFIK